MYYVVRMGTPNPLDQQIGTLAPTDFDQAVRWLILKANEYQPRNVTWLYQPELLSILTLRISGHNGYVYYRLMSE